MLITFPNKSAKEIVEECCNKLGSGKLLYSTWLEGQDFFTKEKCRSRTVEVSDQIKHLDKTWDECSDFVKKKGGEMLNFAEYIWFVKCHFERTGKYPEENEYKWSWTSSRSSLGYLVCVG